MFHKICITHVQNHLIEYFSTTPTGQVVVHLFNLSLTTQALKLGLFGLKMGTNVTHVLDTVPDADVIQEYCNSNKDYHKHPHFASLFSIITSF